MSAPLSGRAKYLTIAAQQFADHGFHGVSLAALAKEAGVSKQAFLHFFGTKERLYGEVLTQLGTRLCEEIDATRAPTPDAHLHAYFTQMGRTYLSDQRDVRLVVRALLDSDAKAKTWPLKPYLDRLVELIHATPRGVVLSHDQALAEAYRFIGAVQYIAISLPTLEGIFGQETRDTLAATISDFADEAVSRLSK